MKSLLTNWKTTVSGLLTIVVGGLSLIGVKIAGQAAIDPQVAIAMITGGFGILFAKDGNVTGGTTPQ